MKVQRAANGYIVTEKDCEDNDMVLVFEKVTDLIWHLKEALEMEEEDWQEFCKEIYDDVKEMEVGDGE